MTSPPLNKEKFLSLLANLRASTSPNQRIEISQPDAAKILAKIDHDNANKFSVDDDYTSLDKYGNTIHYNKQQKLAISYALAGRSFIIIGPAGTGKTTAQMGVTTELIRRNKAGTLQAGGHKYLLDNTPGIVVCAFTKVAVNNIRRNLPPDLKSNCITIHKLLEFEPVFYDVKDPDTGDSKKKMNFEPTRDFLRQLPSTIKWIIIEESSMLSLDLWKQLYAATPRGVNFLFLGDIQQLPPVFGPAILGFKLLELPVIELTEVYRQALESPIIRIAHRVLSGIGIPKEDYPSFAEEGKLVISNWGKKVSDEDALFAAVNIFKRGIDSGRYSPAEDMILIPFNKAFGTIELNKGIANYLAKKAGDEVYQIISGFNKLYFRVGEKVLYDKEDATITRIESNIGYTGVQPLPHSTTLDYWGYDSAPRSGELDNEDIDLLLSAITSGGGDKEDRVNKASHKITIFLNNSEKEISIQTAGEINSLLLGYALTVHKAQGSKWRKVFFITHQSHAKMLQREMLYTAFTRAREELYIICEPEALMNGIRSQRVKGNTLAEKAEFFKGKIVEGYNPDE